jgi:hypothetical protein
MLSEDDEYINAEYLEFDMVFVRKGVFEKITYPWFRPYKCTNEKEQQFVDIDICNTIKEQGIPLVIDKQVDLHEGNFNFVKVI